MEFSAFREALMSLAMKEGFSDCEVYLKESQNFEVLVQESEIAHLENSIERGICFRGTWNGQMGYAYAENLNEESISFLIQEAAANASILEDTNPDTLYKGSILPFFQGYNKNLNTISTAERIVAAKHMEAGALELSDNDHLAAIDYCILSFHEQTISIINSIGLEAKFRKNYFSAYVCALAQQNGDTKTGSDYFIGNNWAEFSPQDIGRSAAKQAVNLLGAYSISSGEYHVLLENHVFADLLSAFCSVFYGENIEKGFSLLADKLHEKIASSKVTLRDDGFIATQIGSVPFDSEGVLCQNKTIISNGRLEMCLHNLKTARAAHVAPTGNGFKASPQSPIKTACTNFYIVPSQKTPRTLMAQLGDGLLISDISGLHAGTNSISGDFSLSAEGFWIERGQIIRPVEQITIAGNFYTLLKNIEDIGNNLRFLPPKSCGTIGAPMVMIKRLSVAGN